MPSTSSASPPTRTIPKRCAQRRQSCSARAWTRKDRVFCARRFVAAQLPGIRMESRRGRQLGVLQMKSRRILISACKREQFGFAVQFSEECQASGSSRAAGVLEIARVVRGILGGIASAQAVRQNHGGMSRKIRNDKLLAAGRRHYDVKIVEHF